MCSLHPAYCSLVTGKMPFDGSLGVAFLCPADNRRSLSARVNHIDLRMSVRASAHSHSRFLRGDNSSRACRRPECRPTKINAIWKLFPFILFFLSFYIIWTNLSFFKEKHFRRDIEMFRRSYFSLRIICTRLIFHRTLISCRI